MDPVPVNPNDVAWYIALWERLWENLTAGFILEVIKLLVFIFLAKTISIYKRQLEDFGGRWYVKIFWNDKWQNILIGQKDPNLTSEAELALVAADDSEGLRGLAIFNLKSGTVDYANLAVRIGAFTFTRKPWSTKIFPYLAPLEPTSWTQTIEFKKPLPSHPMAQNPAPYLQAPDTHKVVFTEIVSSSVLKGEIFGIVNGVEDMAGTIEISRT